MTPVHLYQIAYSEASRAQVQPGYALLDNLANPRPDCDCTYGVHTIDGAAIVKKRD